MLYNLSPQYVLKVSFIQNIISIHMIVYDAFVVSYVAITNYPIWN